MAAGNQKLHVHCIYIGRTFYTAVSTPEAAHRVAWELSRQGDKGAKVKTQKMTRAALQRLMGDSSAAVWSNLEFLEKHNARKGYRP